MKQLAVRLLCPFQQIVSVFRHLLAVINCVYVWGTILLQIQPVSHNSYEVSPEGFQSYLKTSKEYEDQTMYSGLNRRRFLTYVIENYNVIGS